MRATMHFTRLGQASRKKEQLDGAAAIELGIAQLLGLAASAGFRFDVIDGRLVTTSGTPDWRRWPTLRALLDEIGTDAVLAYFEHVPPDRHRALSAPAVWGKH